MKEMSDEPTGLDRCRRDGHGWTLGGSYIRGDRPRWSYVWRCLTCGDAESTESPNSPPPKFTATNQPAAPAPVPDPNDLDLGAMQRDLRKAWGLVASCSAAESTKASIRCLEHLGSVLDALAAERARREAAERDKADLGRHLGKLLAVCLDTGFTDRLDQWKDDESLDLVTAGRFADCCDEIRCTAKVILKVADLDATFPDASGDPQPPGSPGAAPGREA